MKKMLEILRDRLTDRGWTVSTAESCTGGRIASLMTSVVAEMLATARESLSRTEGK